MRTLRFLLLAIILVVLVLLSVANRAPITLNLLPEGMADILVLSVQVPLFVVILAALGVGVVLGYAFEWTRGHKHRRAASVKSQEAARLDREIAQLRKDTNRPKDEVLALIGG